MLLLLVYQILKTISTIHYVFDLISLLALLALFAKGVSEQVKVQDKTREIVDLSKNPTRGSRAVSSPRSKLASARNDEPRLLIPGNDVSMVPVSRQSSDDNNLIPESIPAANLSLSNNLQSEVSISVSHINLFKDHQRSSISSLDTKDTNSPPFRASVASNKLFSFEEEQI